MNLENANYERKTRANSLSSQYVQEGDGNVRRASQKEVFQPPLGNADKGMSKGDEAPGKPKENSSMWKQHATNQDKSALLRGGVGGDQLVKRHQAPSADSLLHSTSPIRAWQDTESLSACEASVDAASSHLGAAQLDSSNLETRGGPAGKLRSSLIGMSQSSLAVGLKELSAGLTFRRTTRGFYLYWNDDRELVFLDETNTLHKLDDGFDVEEMTSRQPQRSSSVRSEAADFRDGKRESKERRSESAGKEENSQRTTETFAFEDIGVEAQKELDRVQQLNLIITKQLELLGYQCQQYKQYLDQMQEHPYPQQQQEIEEQYRPFTQKLTSQQQELLEVMRQAMEHLQTEQSQSFIKVLQQIEHHSKQQPSVDLRTIQETVFQVKENERHLVILSQQAENQLKSSVYPPFQGRDVSNFQQHLQNMHQGQYSSWNQFLQAVQTQGSILKKLQQESSTFSALGQRPDNDQLQRQSLLHQEQWCRHPSSTTAPSFTPQSEGSGSSLSAPQTIHEQSNRIVQTQNVPSSSSFLRKGSIHNDQEGQPAADKVAIPSVPYGSKMHQQAQETCPPATLSGPRGVSSSFMSTPSLASSTTSQSNSRPQFSGHFDSQRRPIYVDPTGNHFRLNACRQPEYIQESELVSLSLSKK